LLVDKSAAADRENVGFVDLMCIEIVDGIFAGVEEFALLVDGVESVFALLDVVAHGVFGNVEA